MKHNTYKSAHYTKYCSQVRPAIEKRWSQGVPLSLPRRVIVDVTRPIKHTNKNIIAFLAVMVVRADV